MIAALDSIHSDKPGVLKGTENDKHAYSDPKTQIYVSFFIFDEWNRPKKLRIIN
jgi:hypothetical protein